jgi:hypothetical protein
VGLPHPSSQLFLLRSYRGCQMVCFQTKNPNLGKVWMVLQWKIFVLFYINLVYFMEICYIFFPFWCVVPRKIWQPRFLLHAKTNKRGKKLLSAYLTQCPIFCLRNCNPAFCFVEEAVLEICTHTLKLRLKSSHALNGVSRNADYFSQPAQTPEVHS